MDLEYWAFELQDGYLMLGGRNKNARVERCLKVNTDRTLRFQQVIISFTGASLYNVTNSFLL